MMDVVGVHESTDSLPDPWRKQEEYYYWPDTGLVAGIIEVLRVRRTGSKNYNDARPISWYQYFPSGAIPFIFPLAIAGMIIPTPAMILDNITRQIWASGFITACGFWTRTACLRGRSG
jgi:hypothetical protein